MMCRIEEENKALRQYIKKLEKELATLKDTITELLSKE